MAKKSKLTTCKLCGEEIAVNAKICPKCGGKIKKPIFKRVWFWVLVIICVIGIGSSGGDDETDTSIENSSNSSAVEADTAKVNETISETEETIHVENPVTEKVTISEQVIFDAEGIKITANEYVEDSIWGEGIKLLIENTTENDVGIGCDALIVNDYMIYDLFSSTVAAGKKANETLYLSSSELKAAGISNVGKVEVQFHLFDADTYMTTYTGECITIETSAINQIDLSADISGTELMNIDGIRVLAQAVDENSFWGAAIVFHIENNSGKNVIIECEDCSVNGYMMSAFLYSEVYDGKKAVDTIDLYSSELEENGIEKIEEIELKIKVINSADFSSVYETEPITITK